MFSKAVAADARQDKACDVIGLSTRALQRWRIDGVIAKNNHNKNYLNNGTVTSLSNGYPIDGEGSSASPDFYTTDADDRNVEWAGSLVTLYSANYLRWYHNPNIPTKSKGRIDIAQESVTNLINSSPNVDFGLQVFNRNNMNKWDNERNNAPC